MRHHVGLLTINHILTVDQPYTSVKKFSRVLRNRTH